MSAPHLPWLELSILVPLTGAGAAWWIADRDRAKTVTVVVCLLALLCTIGAWFEFSGLIPPEASGPWSISRAFGGEPLLVMDELSAPLLPLAALLYLTTLLMTPRTKIPRMPFGLTLLSEALLLAMLGSRQPWLIIGLLGLATIPPWIELRKRHANTRIYTIHMATLILLMTVGQFLLESDATAKVPSAIGIGLLTLGALIRSGIFPLHCWMVDLFEKSTFGTALLFVTPMAGAYAVMRLVFPIAPSWVLGSIAVLSLVTAVYASGMSLIQHDSRRFFCYLFLSHSSLVLVGLEMATPVGLAGGLCVWLSVGISLLGFGLALRSVEARTGRLALDGFHGLFEHTPFLAGMFLLTGLASIGFPGTIGFIGMELLSQGALQAYPVIGVAVVIAAALNGIAVVQAYFHVFTGTRHTASISMGSRTTERFAILAMVVLIIGGGLVPQPGVDSRYHAARALLTHRSAMRNRQTYEVSDNILQHKDGSPSIAVVKGE